MVAGECVDIVGGNPTVSLDSRFVDMGSMLQLDMSTLNSTELQEIDVESTYGSTLLLTVEVTDPVCDTFPDPILNLEQDRAWFNHSDQPVFGLAPDGSYLLHDVRLLLDENTIENPLIDGGGAKVLASISTTNPDSTSYICANAPQNIFNEEYCKLSTEENVCTVKYENAYDSLELTAENLVELFNVTQRYVYGIGGLNIYDDTIDPMSPCVFRSVTRWIPIAGTEAECNAASSVSIDTTTRSQMAAWIYEGKDENTVLRDMIFRGSCHADDEGKIGFNVYVADEDQCFQNVHPDYS